MECADVQFMYASLNIEGKPVLVFQTESHPTGMFVAQFEVNGSIQASSTPWPQHVQYAE
jgi:hypothetical protein